MNDIFDKLGATLNDYIGSPANNNVGWAWEQMQPQKDETLNLAEGGLATEDIFKGVTSAAKDTFGKGTNPYTTGYTNSPAYVAQHYTSLGKFFHVGEPTNNNSTRFPTTEKNKITQSENPNDFYAKWYMGMRRLAEAQEIASRGQAGTRIKN